MSIECIGTQLEESEAATNTKLISQAAAGCVIPSQCADMTDRQPDTEDYCWPRLPLYSAYVVRAKTYLSEKLKKQTRGDVLENLFENGSSLSALIQCLKEGKDPPCQSRNHPDSANLIL